jgi:hypothetical protein
MHDWKDMLITFVNPWSKRANTALTKAGFSEHQVFNARRMVAAELLIGFLYALKIATARGDGDDDDDDDKEYDADTGRVYYLAMRTLLEQEAFIWIPEIYKQTGQLMDFVPVGFAALMDLWNLGDEGIEALNGYEKGSKYFYHRDDKNGRYDKYDSKFEHHLERLIPYWKSVWAIEHPYEAAENYEFGRKLRTR